MTSLDLFLLVLVCAVGLLIAIPLVLLTLMVIGMTWPLLVCWHFGHPVVGVLAEVIYLAAINR
jgi:hypothetical protein